MTDHVLTHDRLTIDLWPTGTDFWPTRVLTLDRPTNDLCPTVKIKFFQNIRLVTELSTPC